MIGLSGAARAQNDASPLIPNLNGFSLPASRSPSDTPVPTPTPTPIATPTPEPTATTLPRAPAPRATPTPRVAPTPVARPTATPEPSPAATSTPTTEPAVETSPTPAATPTVALPAAVEAEQSNGPWLWLGLAILALAGLLFAVFRVRSRGDRDISEPAQTIDIGISDADSATPLVAKAPTPVQPATAATPEGRARIDVTMRPVRAGTNLTSGAVDYEIGLRNSGEIPATDVRVDIRLLNASADQAAMLKLLFAQSIEKPLVARFDLAPGQAITLGGMAMIPQEGIVPVAIGGRNFFVPMFSVNVLYGWAGGGQGQTASAWVIGIDRGAGEKMVPFRLDAGPRMHDAVGQRPQGFAITR